MKCAKCGFDNIKALCIDHINGDGAKHRTDIQLEKKQKEPVSGVRLYDYLKKNNYPNNPPLQVLCQNCNMIKRVDNEEFRKSKKYRLNE